MFSGLLLQQRSNLTGVSLGHVKKQLDHVLKDEPVPIPGETEGTFHERKPGSDTSQHNAESYYSAQAVSTGRQVEQTSSQRRSVEQNSGC